MTTLEKLNYSRNHICVARSGQNMATALALSFADFETFFSPVSTFNP